MNCLEWEERIAQYAGGDASLPGVSCPCANRLMAAIRTPILTANESRIPAKTLA